jgi:PAS domain S-box-containing protein
LVSGAGLRVKRHEQHSDYIYMRVRSARISGGRRLRRGLADASREIRRHLDSERVLRATADAIQEQLHPRQTSIWLTTGPGDVPQRVCVSGEPATGSPMTPPRSVTECISRQRPVTSPLNNSLAVPILAPQSGLLGVVYLDRVSENIEQQMFVDSLANEAGMALEAANLYETAVAEREKTDAILARIGDGVMVTDTRGTVRQWNEAVERITGCPSGEAIGKRCEDVLQLCGEGNRPLDCSKGCALLALAKEGDSTLGREVWRPGRNGVRQPLLANVEVVRDPDGAVSEVVHSFRDVTRLKQADEAKTLFLATASHELKTPLTVIQGFAETLRTEAWDEAERSKALEAMERRAGELSQIVDRILLSSRIETGRTEMSLDATSLGPILEERVQSLAAATGREVVAEIDEDLPDAFVDPNAVTTAVDHLLDNAVKYSPEGGRVKLAATSNDRAIQLTVSDEGIGMDSEQAAHCFEKFWQAESSDVRRFGGTGIGLYIVNSLVEAMLGKITVESTPGEGTTFRVTLPRAGVPVALPSPVAVSAPVAEPEPQPVAVAMDQHLEPGVGDPSVIREFMRQIGIPERRAS